MSASTLTVRVGTTLNRFHQEARRVADRRAFVTQPSYLSTRRRRRRSRNSGACTTNSALDVSADHFEWVVADAGAASGAVLAGRY